MEFIRHRFALGLVVVLTVAGCGGDSQSVPEPVSTGSATTEPEAPAVDEEASEASSDTAPADVATSGSADAAHGGRSPSGPATSSGPGPSSSASRSTRTDPPVVTPSPSRKEQDRGFAWVPPGPADRGDPGPFFWYDLLLDRECDTLSANIGDDPEQRDPLWVALAAVCRAVGPAGSPNDWATAEEFGARVPVNGDVSCLDAEGRRLLLRALDWHRANPGAQAQVVPPTGSGLGGFACPLSVTGIQAMGPDGQWSAALHGSSSGGTPVVLWGRGLKEDAVEVRFGGQGLPIERRCDVGGTPGSDDAVVVRVPAGAPGTLEFSVRLGTETIASSVALTFEFVHTDPLPLGDLPDCPWFG